MRTQLVRDQPFLAIVNLLVALTVAVPLALWSSPSKLLGWLALVALSQLARLAAFAWILRPAPERSSLTTSMWLAFLSALAGASWGVGAMMFTSIEQPQILIAVALAIAGLAAGTVEKLSPHLPSFFAFLLGSLVPFILALASTFDAASNVLSASVIAYMVGVTIIGVRTHVTRRRSVETELHNEELIDALGRAQRQLGEQVEKRQSEIEALLDAVPAAICIAHDPHGAKLTLNRYARDLVEQGCRETAGSVVTDAETGALTVQGPMSEAVIGEHSPLRRAVRDEEVKGQEMVLHCTEGRVVHQLCSARPTRGPRGEVVGAVMAAIDITAQMRAQAQLRASERRFQDFASSASDWLWETDAEHRFSWLSQNVERLIGVSPEQLRGTRAFTVPGDTVDEVTMRRFRRALRHREAFRELEFRRASARGDVWFSMSGVPFYDEHNEFAGYRGIGRNITERKRQDERVRHLAYHDALTGLANRRLLREHLHQALASVRRKRASVALILLDLDSFKQVNDRLGHPVGDELLCQVSDRLRRAVRESDVLARQGGDEFAILLNDSKSRADTQAFLQRVRALFDEPFALSAATLEVAASMGAASAPQDAATVDELMKRADLALYRAKEEGGGRARFFDETDILGVDNGDPA